MTDNISTKTLQELGFSPNEAKIYETLLALKEATVAEISQKANLHRRNVYDAVNRLVEKGLIFQNFKDKETVYTPIDPDKLLDIVKEKEVSLLNIMPYLKTLHKGSGIPAGAHVYKGLEGFKNYVRDILRTGEDVYMLGGLAWKSDKTHPLLIKAMAELEKKDKKFKMVFDDSVRSVIQNIPHKDFSGKYKFFPLQNKATSSVDIFGDYVGGYSVKDIEEFEDDAFIFLIKDKSLTDTVRNWWQYVWDSLPEEK